MLIADHGSDPCALLGCKFRTGASLPDGLGPFLGRVLRVGLHVLAGGALFILRTLGLFALDVLLGRLLVPGAGFHVLGALIFRSRLFVGLRRLPALFRTTLAIHRSSGGRRWCALLHA